MVVQTYWVIFLKKIKVLLVYVIVWVMTNKIDFNWNAIEYMVRAVMMLNIY